MKSYNILQYSCYLGEGPVWDKKNECIWWVDILGGHIHSYTPSSDTHNILHTDHQVGAVALRESGGLIAAIENGIAMVNMQSGEMSYVAKIEEELNNNRFNDGKCDPQGRFWAGTMDDVTEKGGAGKLYMLDHMLQVSEKVSDVSCSNGLAWNSEGSLLYYIDSPTREVVAFDYDNAMGGISNKRVIIRIPNEDGIPDGMTIDKDGMLWIALWNGWKVARYDPSNGQLLAEVPVPVAQVTSCTFGGTALDELYITTARKQLTDAELATQPLAGCLFICKDTGCAGLPAHKFNG